MNKEKEIEYQAEIERLNLKLKAISFNQQDVVAWYIAGNGEITKDAQWAQENPDLCEPLVIAKSYDNLEWIPDMCDCNLEDKDNCEMCDCGMSGYWEEKE